MFTFKTSINVLSICIISLMVLSACAEEKTPTTEDAEAAAMSAVVAWLNADNNPEEVAAQIPADVIAAVAKKLLSKIEINRTEIDATAAQIFRSPIYRVKPLLKYTSIVDGDLLDLNYHGSSAILAGYLKLIRDDFVLDSAEKANLLAKAFQNIFPYDRSDGGKFIQPVKLDKGWLLIRGEFFKNHSGLVFTTDEKGKITLVEYILKINPEDYSYEAPTNITLDYDHL